MTYCIMLPVNMNSRQNEMTVTMKGNNFMKKAVVIITIYFFLLLLRKTILSFDIRILHWLLNDVKFPNHEGHVKGFLNLGKIKYNLTHMKLSVTIEHSNIDTSSLWEFTHTGTRYFNITLQNGNANFCANWAYSAWPSLADSGRLTLDINNASLQFGVDISSDQHGFINFTSSDCTVKIMRVNLEFYHKPNMLFDSIKPSLKKKAKDNLPKGLCEALRRGLLERISSSIQNVQHKFVNFILSGDVKNHQNLTNALGWILVYIFIIAVKVVHDYGVTLLLMIAILALYLLYELVKFIIVTFCSTLPKHHKTKVRSLSDPEPPEQENPVLTPVSVTVVSREAGNTFLAKCKKLLWWRKPKEN